MNTLHIQLVTPERIVLSDDVASLSCPTTLGQITILPHHAPLVATLTPGELVAKKENDEYYINVSGGFVQVQDNGTVAILADAAEHHNEINLQRAEEARKRAEAALKEVRGSEEEYARVAASLERSLSRINVARKRSQRKTPITSEGNFSE